MTEIKFRAWDYEDNQMYDDSQIVIHDGTVFIGKIKYIHQISDDTELMQHIGLRDKNDVEIYEGDIIKIGDLYYELIWENGKACELHNDKDKYAPRFVFKYLDRIEVVGNIYENKELLND